MLLSKSARSNRRRRVRQLVRFVAATALLTQTAGGCFNTEETCADLGKVPTCNVGAQAGTAGTAGTSGAGGGGTAGDTGAAGEGGAAGEAGARSL
jgi:hypothetical protein